MSEDALKIISKDMDALGINYSFIEEDIETDEEGNATYPYWTGEYQEVEPMSESGQHDSVFILSGFTRGTWADLEKEKEKISNYYNKVSGRKAITEKGSAVVIFYNTGSPVPTGDANLKKMQINLDVKEWSVN